MPPPSPRKDRGITLSPRRTAGYATTTLIGTKSSQHTPRGFRNPPLHLWEGRGHNKQHNLSRNIQTREPMPSLMFPSDAISVREIKHGTIRVMTRRSSSLCSDSSWRRAEDAAEDTHQALTSAACQPLRASPELVATPQGCANPPPLADAPAQIRPAQVKVKGSGDGPRDSSLSAQKGRAQRATITSPTPKHQPNEPLTPLLQSTTSSTWDSPSPMRRVSSAATSARDGRRQKRIEPESRVKAIGPS